MRFPLWLACQNSQKLLVTKKSSGKSALGMVAFSANNGVVTRAMLASNAGQVPMTRFSMNSVSMAVAVRNRDVLKTAVNSLSPNNKNIRAMGIATLARTEPK